jgi:site-specific DNA-cytosine methylase
MKTKKLNVLSLFDGVGTAYLALQKAGLEIENYYSSEIDKSAISVLNYHYSANTSFHHIGDVTRVSGLDYAKIDLVVLGSPCTQLSSVNPKDRSGLEGPDSKLFYNAIQIMKDIITLKDKPLYFIMENVASMSNKNKELITVELKSVFGEEIELFKIDSALVASAHRRRYYWTNIPNIQTIEPNSSSYQDIIVSGFADRNKANVVLSSSLTLTNGIIRYYQRDMGNIIFKDKVFAELPTEKKLLKYPEILKASGYIGKAKSLNDEYFFPNGCYRLPSVLELERMLTFPDGYISGVPNVSKTEKKKLIGLSFTCDVIAHLLQPLKNL